MCFVPFQIPGDNMYVLKELFRRQFQFNMLKINVAYTFSARTLNFPRDLHGKFNPTFMKWIALNFSSLTYFS